jgi:hypothetical protein
VTPSGMSWGTWDIPKLVTPGKMCCFGVVTPEKTGIFGRKRCFENRHGEGHVTHHSAGFAERRPKKYFLRSSEES